MKRRVNKLRSFMRYLIIAIISTFSLSAQATFYFQAQAGLNQNTKSRDGTTSYSGTTYTAVLGKKLGIMSIEGTYTKNTYSRDNGTTGNDSEYDDDVYGVGIRLFLGSYLSLAAGYTQTDTKFVKDGGATQKFYDREGYYAEVGLKVQLNKRSTAFFNFRRNYAKDIDPTYRNR
jgi:hypothetical protein